MIQCVLNWEFSRRIRDSATRLGARRLTYADPHMRNLLLALLHLAVVTAKLCGSGGVRAVVTENLLLKQQLLVLRDVDYVMLDRDPVVRKYYICPLI